MAHTFDWLTLDEGEEVVWSGRPRWQTVLKVAAVGAALALAVGAVEVRWGVVAAVVAAGVTGLAYLGVRNTDYVLTNRNLYEKTGVLSTSVSRLPLSEVQNVDTEKGALGNLFDFGSVRAYTAGGDSIAVSNVDDPRALRERLATYSKRASEERGATDAPGRPDSERLAAVADEARRLREAAESLERAVTGR